jgi:enterochelin esterase family protein
MISREAIRIVLAALLMASLPALAAGLPAGPVRTEIPAGTLASPRLQALSFRIKAGDRAAVPRFWAEIAKTGTPLVESVPGEDPQQLLVTFLWRDEEDLRGVVLLGSLSNDAPLARLAGTDVWYRSYRVRRDARFTYRLAPVREKIVLDAADPHYDRQAVRATAGVDPRNPHRHPPAGEPLLSVVELPDAPPATWSRRRPGTPAGEVRGEQSFRSAALGGTRPVSVYTPPGYTAAAAPYPVLVVLDGTAYRELIPLPVILDSLIAAGRIPPVVAVLVGRLEAAERESDLACNPAFARFLAVELLPWVQKSRHITADPARTVVLGSSLGGLAAACAAIEHPERFGNVLAQSGSFPWQPEGAARPEWVARRLAAGAKLPLRFSLDVGLFETWPPPKGGPSLLAANQHLRDVLREKGYEVAYAEYAGGHGHANWQATLPEELAGLLGGWQKPP